MPAKVFVDTNILLCGHDLDAGEKHLRAAEVLEQLWTDRTGVLSPQVLQEFYVNVTRKISKPLAKVVARRVMGAYSIWCIETSSEDVLAACRIEEEARISFWDALICASAIKAGAEMLDSEDLNSGQKIAGLHIQNPFR